MNCLREWDRPVPEYRSVSLSALGKDMHKWHIRPGGWVLRTIV